MKMPPFAARSPLQIIQTNLQHKQIAAATLRRVLEVNHQTVALIQEPWISKNRICGLGNIGGKLFVDTTAETPRTCIFLPNTITATLLNQFCSRDLTAVQIQTDDQQPLVLASAYMPGDGDIPSRELAGLVEHCEASNWDLIISTDCNAHHPLWGSKESNSRGESLTEYLFQTNLTIVNRGTEPTFVSSRYQTIIDITLASQHAAGLIDGWHVSKVPSFADHRRICFQIQFKIPDPVPFRNPRKTNVTRYKNILETHIGNTRISEATLDKHAIETNVQTLTTALTESYKQACPEILPKDTGKSSWWGPELERLRRELGKLFNKAKNSRLDTDWGRYKIAQRHYKKRIRFRKSEAWQNFCSNINTANQAVRVKKVLAKGDQNLLNSLKKEDGTYTQTGQETSELLLKTHFPGCKITEDQEWSDQHLDTPTTHERTVAERIVTAEKIEWALGSFKPFKSAGLDGIFPALLQWHQKQIIKLLLPIYRACIAYKYIPKTWREAKVVFLAKPGKEDYTQAKSFRPISLTSFLLKTLERLVDRYLRDEVLKSKPLHPQQHAYSKGRSTESALHSVVHKIESAITNKASTLAAFIDIEGAFDKTMHTSINHALQTLNVEPVLRSWITELVSQRAVQVTINTTTRATVVKGCPQGGVLSPLIWNIVVDSLIRKLNNRGYTTIGYADDIAILLNGTAENVLCHLLRSALRIVEEWCDQHQLSVNPKKTEVVLFTHKRKLPEMQLPTLFGTKLSLSPQVKYLGITLDSKLNWGSQLNAITRKACIAFWQCKRLVGKRWGLNPKTTLWLYTAVIRPIITYGSVVWWPRTRLATTKTKLRSLQRLASVAATSCMRTTPSAALEYLLDLKPLHLVIQEEAAASALRLRANGLWKHDGVTPHSTILRTVLTEIPLLGAPIDKIPSQYVFDRSYDIQLIPEKTDSSGIHEVRIYTDGSKTEQGTGAGVFSNDLNIYLSTTLDKRNTIFQAECIGITKAAQAAAARDVGDINIKIISDSASVLQALKSNTINTALTWECHQALQSLARTNKVTLQWIKGHSNSLGNDAADELAKRGSSTVVNGPEPLLPIPMAQTKTWLRNKTEENHLKEWRTSEGCRQTKSAIPGATKKFTRHLKGLSRDKTRKVIGIITGHCPLNRHLFNIGVTDSPLCRGCMEAEETPMHVILECGSVAEQRAKFLKSPSSLPEACNNISGLLAFWGCLGWLE